MTPKQKKRFAFVAAIIGGVSLATVLGLQAIKENANYFIEPSDIIAGEFTVEQSYRIGGIVKPKSVDRLADGITVEFMITDCAADVPVRFTGILPDLFREGQGIVADGKLTQSATGKSTFIASQVLAKHDENYVPNEAAEAVMQAQANQCNGAQNVGSINNKPDSLAVATTAAASTSTNSSTNTH